MNFSEPMTKDFSEVTTPSGGRNQIGQVMGRKGQDTRARLLTAVVRLIADRPLRDLKVSDIAREASVGASSFYVYFPDVSAAVLAARDQHSQATPELLAIVESDWTPANAYARAHAFVVAYRGFWKDNFALLRARNLAYDEGDQRFRLQRCKDIEPILLRLAAKAEDSQRMGLLPEGIQARRVASVCLASVERLAAGNRLTEEAVDAAAYVMTAALGLYRPA